MFRHKMMGCKREAKNDPKLVAQEQKPQGSSAQSFHKARGKAGSMPKQVLHWDRPTMDVLHCMVREQVEGGWGPNVRAVAGCCTSRSDSRRDLAGQGCMSSVLTARQAIDLVQVQHAVHGHELTA